MFLDTISSKLKEQTGCRDTPSLRDLPKPHELKNNVKAAKRILENLYAGKRMLIVGDYDADGIFATTILYSFLQEAGFGNLVEYIIPSRLKDGYGVSPNIVHFALEEGYDFIVTVDNGVAAVEAIDLANSHDLEVIITDHHTAPAVLPNASIIVNPRVPGETLPFTFISGATVAWYLCAALRIELDMKIDIRKYLDYVAITIVSDVMPLDNINLPLLQYGMNLIKKRERVFYQLLWNDWTAPTINETALGFNLVPMINAIGRINDANIGVQLFTSTNPKEIKEYFDFMKSVNEERKELSRGYVREAEKFLVSDVDISSNVIIIRNKDFHEGIVGIIAGKLAEKYKKPAFVLSYSEEKGIWKGSARSRAEIHLYDLTNKVSEFVLGFGGHKGAVGLAVADDQWDNFDQALRAAADSIPAEDFIDKSTIPVKCNLTDMNWDLMNMLESFAPFGHGNQKPILEVEAYVTVDRELKGGLHYKCIILNPEKTHSMVGLFFNVEKEEFLKSISGGKLCRMTIDPNKSYDLRNDQFNIEGICSLIED